jgi:hypothetical protein
MSGRVTSAIWACNSPIWQMVSDTAYSVKEKPTEEKEVKAVIELALEKVRRMSADGFETDKAQIPSIADVIYTNLHGPAPVLAQSGLDTIVNLVLNSGLTPATQEADKEAKELFEKCKSSLVKLLEQPDSIIHSKEILEELFQFKNNKADPKLDLSKVLIEDLVNKMKSSGGPNSPAPDQNQDLLYWPQIHQFMVRCIDVMQDDVALRDARFWLTFAGGQDTIAMWAIFWFVVITLILRTYIARREEAQLVTIHKPLEEWVQNLRGNEVHLFAAVNTAIEEERDKLSKTGKAPILEKALEITEVELVVRGNDSQPDSLLVWMQTVREGNTSSRWLLRWCGRALPTVGFIFKVYGIAKAMKDSDTIARASGAFEQAASIAHVSGALGLAFSATFGAFLLSLVIGLADAWQGHYERKVLSKFENALVPLLLVPPESPVVRQARSFANNLEVALTALDEKR